MLITGIKAYLVGFLLITGGYLSATLICIGVADKVAKWDKKWHEKYIGGIMLVCDKCGSRESIVKNSRNNVEGNSFLKRMRECSVCGNRYPTVEVHRDEKFELRKRNVTQIIQDTAENICDNFCKYRDTCDDNNECEWLRQGNACPLDRIY